MALAAQRLKIITREHPLAFFAQDLVPLAALLAVEFGGGDTGHGGARTAIGQQLVLAQRLVHGGAGQAGERQRHATDGGDRRAGDIAQLPVPHVGRARGRVRFIGKQIRHTGQLGAQPALVGRVDDALQRAQQRLTGHQPVQRIGDRIKHRGGSQVAALQCVLVAGQQSAQQAARFRFTGQQHLRKRHRGIPAGIDHRLAIAAQQRRDKQRGADRLDPQRDATAVGTHEIQRLVIDVPAILLLIVGIAGGKQRGDQVQAAPARGGAGQVSRQPLGGQSPFPQRLVRARVGPQHLGAPACQLERPARERSHEQTNKVVARHGLLPVGQRPIEPRAVAQGDGGLDSVVGWVGDIIADGLLRRGTAQSLPVGAGAGFLVQRRHGGQSLRRQIGHAFEVQRRPDQCIESLTPPRPATAERAALAHREHAAAGRAENVSFA